ncbi:hypothetical protein BU17DRAFT_55867 [Hysterangium stoloniferum]|nr:hypothetical protein BU17DRAFT_55867 [Hysterangium stoloniferum]
MSGLLRPIFTPWRNAFRYTRELAHDKPVIFWSLCMGLLSPVLLIGVPPIRAKMGYVSPAEVPMSYPVPKRQRRPVTGYEDP